MEEKLIVGIERGTNKKYNTPYTVLYTISAFDDYALQNRNAQGNKAENTYIRGNHNCKVNDTVTFNYQPGFNNEAVVSGVVVVKEGK